MNQMNPTVSKARQSLKAFGTTLLILALFDMMDLVPSVIRGDFSIASYASMPHIEIIRVALYVMMGIYLLSILVQVFLGTKALAEAANPTKARYHLVIAKITLVVNTLVAICVIISMVGAKNTGADVLSLLLAIADVTILLGYVIEGNKVRLR